MQNYKFSEKRITDIRIYKRLRNFMNQIAAAIKRNWSI